MGEQRLEVVDNRTATQQTASSYHLSGLLDASSSDNVRIEEIERLRDLELEEILAAAYTRQPACGIAPAAREPGDSLRTTASKLFKFMFTSKEARDVYAKESPKDAFYTWEKVVMYDTNEHWVHESSGSVWMSSSTPCLDEAGNVVIPYSALLTASG